MKLIFPVIFLGAAVIYSCSPKPFAATNKIYKKQAAGYAKILTAKPVDSVRADSMRLPPSWVGTTNFGMRKPNMVILHHTAQNSCDQTLKTFTLQRTQVSAHYVICKDGTLHHMLNDFLRAWHAGNSKWGNNTDINSSSIGIEIDNNGFEPFTEAQLNTLTGLLEALKKAHNIPTANFIGHGDIAPSRKNDPNIQFPWKRFADLGYGYWYNDTTGLEIPPDLNIVHGLRIIGYDVSNLPAAVLAFRRHFLASADTGEFTEPEKKVLFALMERYLN